MAQAQASPAIVRFGAFEVDLVNAELRKSGVRLRIQEQPFQVLAALLARPGEVVTREELTVRLWPDGTFVDFDRGLNAAVARLRQVLLDPAETPRYIETVARRGYRFIAPVETGPAAVKNAPVSAAVQAKGPIRTPRLVVRYWRWQLTVAVGLLGVTTIGWLLAHRSRPEIFLEQITRDRGLETDPALSPDGKLVAYASDRDGRNLEIWVRQLVNGGSAVRLTHGDSDAHQPSFSPDGSRIVYRSERDGGGIEVIPAIGGEPVRLAPQGRDPRFSPDGNWIAYWVGVDKGSVPESDPTGQIFVIPSSGGLPKEVGANLPPGGDPIWSPDSKQLLVYANPRLCTVSTVESDWWIVPLEGAARKTGAFSDLRAQGFTMHYASVYPRAAVWLENSLIFTGKKGDTRNIWRVPFRATDGRLSGTAERLSAGTTAEVFPSFTPQGLLAFASLQESTAIWAIPMNPDQRRVTSTLRRLTEGDSLEINPSISSDGRLLAYDSTVPTNRIALRNAQTGEQIAVAKPSERARDALISRDGSQLVYNIDDAYVRGLFVTPVSGGTPRRINPEPLDIWELHPDNGDLLFLAGDRNTIIMRLHLQTGARSEFLVKSGSSLFKPRYSPDGNWLAFQMVTETGSAGWNSRLYIVRLKNGLPSPGTNWIRVGDQLGWSDKPSWSPDGNTLYFISHRDGFRCIWAQPLGPATKDPIGDPLPIYHFHNSRLSPMNVGLSLLGIDVASDKLVVNLGELTGNIWTLRTGR